MHKDFKTANVLVDENFIPKVADAGLRNFLGRIDIAGPSSQVVADEIFLAPEYYSPLIPTPMPTPTPDVFKPFLVTFHVVY